MLERPVVGSFPGNGEVSTVHGSAAIRPVSGVKPTSRDRRSTDAFDPNVWSGRALQEVFVDPADAVLH